MSRHSSHRSSVSSAVSRSDPLHFGQATISRSSWSMSSSLPVREQLSHQRPGPDLLELGIDADGEMPLVPRHPDAEIALVLEVPVPPADRTDHTRADFSPG